MSYPLQYTIFIMLGPLTAGISIGMALYAWRYRASAPAETRALVQLMGAVIGWTLSNTLELLAPTAGGTLFWAKITYFFITATLIAWFVFALTYAEQQTWLSPRRRLWLYSIPAVTLALIWTNDMHLFYWRGYTFFPINGLLAMHITARGPWFWVFISYSYLLTLFSSGLILHHYFQGKRLQNSSVWIMAGSLLPIAVNLIYLFRPFPWLRKDYTPITFMLASLTFLINLYRYRLFEIKPRARELLLETMPAAVFVLDRQHILVDLNRAGRELLRLPKDTTLPLPATVLLDAYPELLELLDSMPSTAIYTTRYQGDTHTHYEWRSWPLRDARAQQQGWMLLGHDITLRKHTENDLRAREARLSALLAAMQDYVFVLDREGNFSEYYQPGKATELYVRPEDFLGRPYHEVLPPQVSVPLAQAIGALEQNQPPQSFTYPLPLGNIERWYMAQLSPLQNIVGKTYGYLGVVRDITELKAIEYALRRSEERYQFIVQAQHEVICRYLPDTTLLFVNAAYCRMVGKSEAELLGVPFISLVLESEQALVWDVIARLTPPTPNFTHEHPVMLPDGTRAWYEWHDQGFFDAEGNLYEVLAVGRDITERKQARAQILEHQQQLAVFKERERLARELHDGIGQVLGYINVQSQAALDHLREDPAIVTELLERLNQVTRDAHSDLRGYILGLKRSTADMAPFTEQLHAIVNQFKTAYGFEVQLDIPPDLPATVAEPLAESQLLYIIREALSNARQHSGVNVARVLLRLDAEAVTITISDAGRGFNLTLAHILERKPSRAHFGLQVMIERAEAVGGRFSIQTHPGGGTLITVDMPRQHPLKALPQLRIMLVDDHPLFLQGLRNLLSARGLEVVGMARNGLEAQQLARNLRPDLILMDLHMPECDGLEATLRIKAELPEVKIVILTVAIEEKSIYQALKNGASGYLLKNLSANDLSELLADIMRGEVVFSPGIASQMLSELVNQRDQLPLVEATLTAATQTVEERALYGLTPRQTKILELVAQGMTYKEVGTELFITERTVKYHMGEILERLQLENRREAIAFARRANIEG